MPSKKSVQVNVLLVVDGLTPEEADAFIKDIREMAQAYADNTEGEISFLAHIPEPPRPDPNAN